MDIETFKQLLPFLPKLINYAKTCYKWLKDSGISNESISWGAAFVLAVGLILLSVYYVLKSFFEFVEHLAGYFFGFFKDLSKYKRAFRFLKHFLNSIQPSAVIASLSVLFIFHRKLDSDLGQNQRFVLALIAIGMITFCLIIERPKEQPTDVTRVQAEAARVQEDAVGVQSTT